MPQVSHEVNLTQSVLKALDMLECLAFAEQPLYCTAMGKAVLAFLSSEKQATLLNQIALTPRTSNTIADRAA